MSATDFSREPLQVVEIVQPLCSRTFEVSPCDATGDECWNTIATCKFLTALDMTDEVVMRFVAPAANRFLTDAGAFQPATAFPALVSADTAPAVLNVAAGNDDLSPLGLRAVASVVIKDFPYNDVGFDPYLSARSYDPMQLGSFWSKWLARNPYHTGYTLRIYDGFFGDALGDMIKREYSIEKIDASRSAIRITAKDILRKVTDTKVTAPALSPGALSLNLLIGGTSFQAAGAILSDYQASGGWVRINSEIIQYTAAATVSSNVEFTGLTRGALGTTAAAHNQFDRVQRVLAYEDEPFQDIIYDLLTVWGGIPAAYIDKTAWDDEKLEWREIYNFTAYLSDPVDVQQLVGELCQQAQSNIWWDERIQEIILRAQRPNFLPGTLTQEGHIIADSVTIEEVAKDRASQVYIYYGLRIPTLSVADKFSYRAAEVFIDVDAEFQYGEPAVKEIFCRWVNTSVIAQSLGSSYIRRFRDVRKHMTFNLTSKDIAQFWTGDVAEIKHFMYVDFTGAEKIDQWLITSAETVEQGGVYRFVAEDNGSAGVLWEWVADDETRPSTETGAWVDAAGTDGAGNVLPFGWI
jgi:hypothetical protein